VEVQETINCPRCKRPDAPGTPKVGVCHACYRKILKLAEIKQANVYHAWYLHGRVNAKGELLPGVQARYVPSEGRHVMQLVREAKAIGIDWMNPPESKTFRAYLDDLLAPYRSITAQMLKEKQVEGAAAIGVAR
jgi:hypothetical protein